MDATDESSAPNDRTVQFRLKRPFLHLPEVEFAPNSPLEQAGFESSVLLKTERVSWASIPA